MRHIIVILITLTIFLVACAKQLATIELTKNIQGVKENKEFRDMCRNNNHGWMAMRPMKDGNIMSEESCFGCMPDIKNHICDVKEYKRYITLGNFSGENKAKDELYGGGLINPNKEIENEIYSVKNGDIISINATVIEKEFLGEKYKMYSYNNQIPGPLLRVKKGSHIFVNFTNLLDVETTIHWHGLRHGNKNDGVPYLTQEPVKAGASYLYELKFPDEGIYWYHSHFREDAQQEKGLYSNILVLPDSENYFNKVSLEEFLVLDDLLIKDNEIEAFNENFVNYALMGRFGNIMLINGKTNYMLNAKKGDVIRFYITNAANARPFNFSIQGTKLKVIGSDIGKFEREFFTNSIIVAPGERYIVEAFFEDSTTYEIYNKNPEKAYVIGKIIVSNEEAETAVNSDFYVLKENPEIKNGIDGFRKYFDVEPEHQINLSVEFPDLEQQRGAFSDQERAIEWEDDMGVINKEATNNSLTWLMIDAKTNNKNMEAEYKFKIGDVKKIRIFNDKNSVHPMQHPIHLHGQRFLVVEQDGKKNTNLAWKDTVLVPKGSYADILVDFTNPGHWMMHCHNSEHLQSGMMTMFNVI